MAKKIVIASHHGGFVLKEKIIAMLKKRKYRVEDMGAFSDSACDYPLFGYNAAKKVSSGEVSRGIVICKSGIGMSIVANKLPGVRAGLCISEQDAESSRKHNDTNVLVLGASKVKEKKALDITKTWLKTSSLKGRHARRVKQINDIEKKVFKKIKEKK
jgi:RpiB/LacA/LacB family sugar-phosphate isomerase